jgi:outer membrane lipoprotein-sorting protein
MIKNISQSCTKKIGNSSSQKNHTVILIPKVSGAEFEKIELETEKTSGNPSKITLYGKDKSITVFKMTNCKREKNIADSNFSFNKNNHNGVFINDLR